MSPALTDTLNKEALCRCLATYPDAARYVIALSGGIDSSVLLHLMVEAAQIKPLPIVAVHINHRLSPSSDDWQQFCHGLCKDYGVTLEVYTINGTCPPGESLEAWARTNRYALIKQVITHQDILLTAHHADDQAETVLLHLLRGSGSRGLAGMLTLRRFYRGWHARPLLNCSQAMIVEYARQHRLSYVSDQGNYNPQHNRNYLRNQVIPLLRHRWPSLQSTLLRAAKHQQRQTLLLDELAKADLARVSRENPQILDANQLKQFDQDRQINLLLYWLNLLGLPIPHAKHLDEIRARVIYSAYSKAPCVNWPGVEIRRYRHLIYALTPLPSHDPRLCLDWDLQAPLTLPLGRLSVVKKGGVRVSRRLLQGKIQVRFRQGGEKISPAGHQHHRTIKRLFQERGLIPWYRDRIPLVYCHQRLVLIPEICVARDYAVYDQAPSLNITWDAYHQVVQ